MDERARLVVVVLKMTKRRLYDITISILLFELVANVKEGRLAVQARHGGDAR